METSALIRALAHEARPEPPHETGWRVALALACGLGGGLVMLLSTLGLRPDLASAMVPVGLKLLFAGALAAATLAVLSGAARPGVGGRAWQVLGVLVGVCLGASALALVPEQPGDRIAAWTGGQVPWCVVLIPTYAVPALLGLTWALREAAPTRLVLAGTVSGALAGCIGALVYAAYCPVDSAAFVATWYVVGIAVTALAGALAGPRLLRW